MKDAGRNCDKCNINFKVSPIFKFCPFCGNLLSIASAEGEQPFHLKECSDILKELEEYKPSREETSEMMGAIKRKQQRKIAGEIFGRALDDLERKEKEFKASKVSHLEILNDKKWFDKLKEI